MKKTTKLRLIGGAILLFNLWFTGRYSIEGIPLLMLTFGFVAGYEYLVVRPASIEEKTLNSEITENSPGDDPSPLSIIGYIAWFAFLVQLLYVATGDKSENFAESIGMRLGLGLGLLALLTIPYLIVRFRAKRKEEPVSWFLVMMGTTIIALLLTVGGYYGQLHKLKTNESAKTVSWPEDNSKQIATQSPQPITSDQTSINVPQNEQECLTRFLSGNSIVKNNDALRQYCQSAFNPSNHPIERARDMCYLIGWSSTSTQYMAKDEFFNVFMEVQRKCDINHPLPACPEGLTFELNNKRCEVKCDIAKGYAPDASGTKCQLACPSGPVLYNGQTAECLSSVYP